MKIKEMIVMFLLSNILFATYVLGQSSANASASINIKVVKPLQINQVKGDLSFGNFVQSGVAAKIERTPEKGILFEVNGSAGRSVVIDYKNANLQKKSSNNEISSKRIIDFKPLIKTTLASSSYTNPQNVSNGSAFELADNNNSGVLYLWVGGEMNIDSQLSSGAYLGDFAITVSY